jgi:hypothetical protein
MDLTTLCSPHCDACCHSFVPNLKGVFSLALWSHWDQKLETHSCSLCQSIFLFVTCVSKTVSHRNLLPLKVNGIYVQIEFPFWYHTRILLVKHTRTGKYRSLWSFVHTTQGHWPSWKSGKFASKRAHNIFHFLFWHT